MHHMFAWVGIVAQNAVGAYIPAPTDQVLTKYDVNTFLPERTLRLQRMYGLCPDATVVQLDSPLLRPIGPPELYPFNVGTEPSDLPPVNFFDNAALPWVTNDPLGVKVTRAGAAAAVCSVFGWISDTPVQKIDGPTWPVKLSVPSTTLTTTGWVAATPTIGQSLPPGNYRITGMACFGATLLAARLVLQSQVWRPGAIAIDTLGEYDWDLFRRGKFGEYGVFNAYALPSVELLGLSAGATTATIWLDIQPVSGQAPTYGNSFAR